MERDPAALVVDHLRLITDRRYGIETRLKIVRDLHRVVTLVGGADRAFYLRHSPDRECCLEEGWPVTFKRLVELLRADGLPAQEVRLSEVSAGPIERLELLL